MIITCGSCKKEFGAKLAPCPSNHEGCCVCHYDENSYICCYCEHDNNPRFFSGERQPFTVKEKIGPMIINVGSVSKLELAGSSSKLKMEED